MLEGYATEKATYHIAESSITRLETLINEMHEALNSDNYDSYILKHYSFHFTIYNASQQTRLVKIIENLWLQIGPWLRQKTETSQSEWHSKSAS